MSTEGRAHDALYEALWGHYDMHGHFYPGPFHDLGHERFYDLVGAVLDTLRPWLGTERG